MLAVFRCDASVGIGGGHVVRCLVLAQSLRQHGWQCGFASRQGTMETISGLTQSGCDILEIDVPTERELQAMQEYWPGGCDLLVVDHYGLGAQFETASRGWASRIMVIDDLANRPHDCDLLLDQNLGRTLATYHGLIPKGCLVFLGPKYALLRPEFSENRSYSLDRRAAAGKIESVMISFGLTDPFQMTALAVEAIVASHANVDIEVVIGEGEMTSSGLRSLGRRLGQRMKVHGTVEDMATLMTLADVAFGACGTTAWERCCLGLPTLLVVVAENQVNNAKGLQQFGAAVNLGWRGAIDIEKLKGAFVQLISDPKKTLQMSNRAAVVCDGLGALRVLTHLMPPQITARGGEVRLQLAGPNDVDIMYEWQQDERTRLFARNPEIPSYEEHKAWYDAKTADDGCYMTLIVHNGEPSGVLRLDRLPNSNAYEVSIYVAPDKFRRGIAKAALACAERLWPEYELHAEVVEENVASHKLFHSAGYVKTSRRCYRKKPCVKG